VILIKRPLKKFERYLTSITWNCDLARASAVPKIRRGDNLPKGKKGEFQFAHHEIDLKGLQVIDASKGNRAEKLFTFLREGTTAIEARLRFIAQLRNDGGA
jgi:hypothetical protein